MRITIVFCFIAFFFSSCYYSNAIYFDVESQSIKSCNKKGIRQLYIKNDSSTETYLIMWRDTLQAVPKSISLKSIKNGYVVYKGWNRTQISINEFKLSASSVYTFERAQGDASSYKIKAWTDEFSNISKTTKSTCDD